MWISPYLIIICSTRGSNYDCEREERILLSGLFNFCCSILRFLLFDNIEYIYYKKRKVHSPSIMVIKYIGFATFLVSMLSLQTAMFASFGHEMPLENQNLMNLITGTSVCEILIVLGCTMIKVANKKLKY